VIPGIDHRLLDLSVPQLIGQPVERDSSLRQQYGCRAGSVERNFAGCSLRTVAAATSQCWGEHSGSGIRLLG